MTKIIPRPRSRPKLESGPKNPEIGYGKPPREHQFKPGQSGNPKGRPKGAKSEATILRGVLEQKIPMRSNNRTRHIPVIEAIHRRMAEQALKGDTKAAAFLLNRYGALISGETQMTDLTSDDREILAQFIAQQHSEPTKG